MRRIPLLSILIGLSLAVCLSTAGCTPPKKEVTILCGNSFRTPMEKLVAMYEKETGKKILLDIGGSEVLFPKVETKAAGDLFVTHAPFMKRTEKLGALLREEPVGFLAPVIVVQKENPKNIQKIDDLAQEGLQVVLPNPEYSTCGEMVQALLQKKGIHEAVLKNVGNAMFRNHQDIGNHVKLGTADVGIMWNGVAKKYLDAVEIVPAPYEYDEEIGVSVMGLSYTKHKEEVEQFLDFINKHGKKVFTEFGYVKEASNE